MWLYLPPPEATAGLSHACRRLTYRVCTMKRTGSRRFNLEVTECSPSPAPAWSAAFLSLPYPAGVAAQVATPVGTVRRPRSGCMRASPASLLATRVRRWHACATCVASYPATKKVRENLAASIPLFSSRHRSCRSRNGDLRNGHEVHGRLPPCEILPTARGSSCWRRCTRALRWLLTPPASRIPPRGSLDVYKN